MSSLQENAEKNSKLKSVNEVNKSIQRGRMERYETCLKELLFATEDILSIAETLKRPEEEISNLHEIVRKIVHVK